MLKMILGWRHYTQNYTQLEASFVPVMIMQSYSSVKHYIVLRDRTLINLKYVYNHWPYQN